MRAISWLLAIYAATALAACSIESVTFTLGSEDCAAAGDEDNNGMADCADPACAQARMCGLGCGNGKVENGEGCDDGNSLDGDGCDNNCTVSGCGNGLQAPNEACDDGNTVSGDGCDNNCTATGCGNGVMTEGEACDDGNAASGDGCDANCKPTGCGNGVMTGTEVCDDGNATSGDGCDSNCTVTGCRNGIPTTGEACDDGNNSNGDGCDNNCTATACGNGVMSGTEVCDDGNATNGDGCDSNCTVTGCRNGIPTAGEACDDGNNMNGDGCDNNCTVTACGNGAMSSGEACDDGNLTNGDGCDSNCTVTACGNGIPTMGEACDDGNMINGDACDNNCTVPGCGNGIPTGTEACDDGNQTNGDGCDNNCTVTACRNGIPTMGEACDDGNNTNGDGCDNNCTATACRNGIPTSPEECDDGNNTNGDACDNNCTTPRCGNGIQAGTEQCDDGNLVNGDGCDSNCTPTGCGNGIPTGTEQCDDGNTTNGDGCESNCTPTPVGSTYVKASNTGPGDQFGQVVALSADGATLAVAAPGEDSAVTGINGNQGDNSATFAGAVYVYTRNGATWAQQAYIKASNTAANDNFGFTIAISADGSTLAVGATGEDSAATGINGNQADDSAVNSGAVYVFTRSGATWSQQAYIKASNAQSGDVFGQSVSLSSDGSTLAVGARGEDSAALNVGGNQDDNTAGESGAAYVFVRTGTVWAQQAYIKATNTGASDAFGFILALSPDGSTLAVNAPAEDSAATGIDGDQANNSAGGAGAVYVYARVGVTWTRQAYVKASNTQTSDQFGTSLSLAGDGSVLAVGTYLEDSAATGVDGDQLNNAASAAGAVYVFERVGTTWSQRAYVKASNTEASDNFGASVALSRDGSKLVVGAPLEDSAATGVGGDQASNSAVNSGAVYVFRRGGASWVQQSYVKATNTGGGDQFGYSVSVSDDGSLTAVGALAEDSAATGIDGDQLNNTALDAGAVYLYR